MRLRNKVLSVVASAVVVVSCCSGVPASAKTLAQSFSSSVSIDYVQPGYSGDYWRKTCTAKTNGYYKYHYVRAYIGGSSSGPNGNAWADTGRCYSYGDISRTARTSAVYVDSSTFPRFAFPTAYAKYGSK